MGARVTLTGTERIILEVISKETGGLTCARVADHLKLHIDVIYQGLAGLHRKGMLGKDYREVVQGKIALVHYCRHRGREYLRPKRRKG